MEVFENIYCIYANNSTEVWLVAIHSNSTGMLVSICNVDISLQTFCRLHSYTSRWRQVTVFISSHWKYSFNRFVQMHWFIQNQKLLSLNHLLIYSKQNHWRNHCISCSNCPLFTVQYKSQNSDSCNSEFTSLNSDFFLGSHNSVFFSS